MKGLQERSGGNGIFLVVKHHDIVQESKKERDGFEPIVVKNPRTNQMVTKYIKRYSGVEAMVKKIEWYDTERKYDQRYRGWKLYLDADGTACVLDIAFDSRQAGRFMKLAENLDFAKPIEFSAWHDKQHDSTAFNVKQDGKSIPQKYTRDNPGTCPPPKEKFGGKWDYSEQEEFLYTQMVNVVIPRVEAVAGMNGHGGEQGTAEFNARPPEDAEYPYDDDGADF
jgi:hypothetical protein